MSGLNIEGVEQSQAARIERIASVIGDVELMGGDTASNILAPSEIRAIAQALVNADIGQEQRTRSPLETTPSWLRSLPPEFHDCFSA